MFKLVIQDDEGKTTVVPLIRDEITIGRKEGNTIRLTERNVSRRHARILRTNGEVSIEDLGSYNGIRVNNARIAERVALRVSDQVQIGDYKLYLKAEGVEQVDDARTMPIERVDTANTATDVIPVAAAPAPTQPMAIQTPAPGTLPPAAQLIGNPNRTLVAVADTDPQGRPVASAAQVAAVLSSPAGYGKLVVLSSNFAGKEFELSRPQMIIGRTDENDIVVNHRSISRNHAKLVREPDTGRYTISDLQSSNGVRVNGQDYGKVELRRGDVVDLGHVRLRFVEAGEDFVFSRDAVITDVPDSSSRKGLVIAIAAGLLLVAAIVIVMVMRKGEPSDKPKTNGSSGDNIAFADAGPQVAVNPGEDGSNAIETDVDAGPTVAPVSDSERLRQQCLQARDAKKWPDLIACGEKLRTIDKAEGQKFYDNGHAEQKAETILRGVTAALNEKALRKAKAELDKLDKDSVYYAEAEGAYTAQAEPARKALEKKLADARKGDCKTWNTLVGQSKADLPDDIIATAKKNEACVPQVAAKDPKEPKDPKDPPPPKDNACEKYDEIQSKATEAFSGGRPGEALTAYKMMYKCRPSEMTSRLVVAASCKAKNLSDARAYWKKLTQAGKDQMLSLCSANGFFLKDLDPSAAANP